TRVVDDHQDVDLFIVIHADVLAETTGGAHHSPAHAGLRRVPQFVFGAHFKGVVPHRQSGDVCFVTTGETRLRQTVQQTGDFRHFTLCICDVHDDLRGGAFFKACHRI